MPIQPTYPGVYIEELPSGVRTITGVATSITAFIGRALRGPINDPVPINGFGDYDRLFGGIWADSMMSYAVKDFYRNGGSQALIVRLEKNAAPAIVNLPAASPGLLRLEAASKGSWGNKLAVSVNYNTKDSARADLFNLTVVDTKPGGLTETFLNVSTNPGDPRYLTRVLEQSSLLVRVDSTLPDNTLLPRPLSTVVPASPPTQPVNTPIPATPNSGSDGDELDPAQYIGDANLKQGLHALKKADLFNLLCIPPARRDGNTAATVYQEALTLCVEQRAMLLVDPPAAWGDSPTPASDAVKGFNLNEVGLAGDTAKNAALYFPRIKQADSERDGQIETFVPCGMIAGIMSRTDTNRGVWKSPAGLDASLNGAQGLQAKLSDAENGQLNPLGINCLRNFTGVGQVVWGARTMRGADRLADTDNKYVAVRRTTLYIEESLYRGTQWVVFEPNDEPLWAQIRLNVGAFMHNLFRQGAFQGKTPREAYLVKCDKETTTQTDINQGVVNILVGFAPLKPAEFVFIRIQQLSGQIDS